MNTLKNNHKNSGNRCAESHPITKGIVVVIGKGQILIKRGLRHF